MSDQSIVDKFFREDEIHRPEKFLVDDQWQYLDSTAPGPSITNQVQFDTLALKPQLVDWQSAYLALPLRLTSSIYNSVGPVGLQYTLNPATTQLALKASVLSLIYSCVLSTGSGQQIVSDQQIHLINNLRLLIDRSVNWMNSEAVELCYAKDVANSAATGTNAGALARCTYMMQQSELVSGPAGGPTTPANGIEYTAIIPLRLIHEVFEAMGMQLNTHFQIQFGLNFQNNSATIVNNFSPWTANAGTDAPYVSIGNSVIPCPRIYYRSLTLSPDYVEKLASTYSGKFNKKISFRVTDVSPLLGTDTIAATVGTAVNKTVSSSSVRPQRLWVLPFESGHLQGQIKPAPFECVGKLKNIQVMVNNQAYFKNPLQTQYECWQEVLRCHPGYTINSQEGNQLNFGDFLGPATPATLNAGAISPYIFDISRIKDRLRSPNDAVTITFSAQKADALAVNDVYYLVEREQHVAFDFAGGGVAYKTGIQV